MLIVNSCYLTRALIKNNIVSPSIYMILLMIEYLMMLYCVLSLIDYQSYLKLFAFTSDILDVKTKINNAQTPQEKDQAITLITTHIYVNYIFCGVYLMVVLITIWQVFKINSIEKTMESSYILKGISFFLICGKTILKIPILTSIFLVF